MYFPAERPADSKAAVSANPRRATSRIAQTWQCARGQAAGCCRQRPLKGRSKAQRPFGRRGRQPALAKDSGRRPRLPHRCIL